MPLSNAPTSDKWEFVTFTGNRILVLTDACKFLQSNTVGGAQVVTIPPNSDVAFEIGTQISFAQLNTAALSFAVGAGVTIQSRGALVAAADQFAVMSIVQRDVIDTWYLFGDLI